MHKIQFLYGLIAVLSGAGAAWLAVTARVKAALISEGHSKAAAKVATEKLKEAQSEIATLRKQITKLLIENATLSGASLDAEDDSDWEAGQSLLDKAAAAVDAKFPAPTIVPSQKLAPIDSKLVFRSVPPSIETLLADQDEIDEQHSRIDISG